MQHLPEDISRELERVVRRWRELPAGRALAASVDVRALVQRLADATDAVMTGTKSESLVPDLGPTVLIDQLRVLVWDAASRGVPTVLDDLTELRRGLP